jgi:hypothetical protein
MDMGQAFPWRSRNRKFMWQGKPCLASNAKATETCALEPRSKTNFSFSIQCLFDRFLQGLATLSRLLVAKEPDQRSDTAMFVTRSSGFGSPAMS